MPQTFTVYLDDESAETLDRLAQSQGLTRSGAIRSFLQAARPHVGLPATSTPQADAEAEARAERKQFLDLRSYKQDIRLGLRAWIETGELPPPGFTRLALTKRLREASKAKGLDNRDRLLFWSTEGLPLTPEAAADLRPLATRLELKLLNLETTTPKEETK